MWICKRCGKEIKKELRSISVREYSICKDKTIDVKTRKNKSLNGVYYYCTNEQCERFAGVLENLAEWKE